MKLMNPVNEIIFTTPERFAKSVKKAVEVGEFPKYKVTDGVMSARDKFTTGANTCSGLALSGGDLSYLGHYAPELRRPDFLEKLDYIIKSFQDKSGEKGSGILAGGYDFNVKECGIDSVGSFNLFADAANLLDKRGVDFTMICGKKNPLYTDSLAVIGDKFIMTQANKLRIKQNFLNNISNAQELEQFLFDTRSVAEISPNHKFIVDI